jgi:hypothetical protein
MLCSYVRYSDLTQILIQNYLSTQQIFGAKCEGPTRLKKSKTAEFNFKPVKVVSTIIPSRPILILFFEIRLFCDIDPTDTNDIFTPYNVTKRTVTNATNISILHHSSRNAKPPYLPRQNCLSTGFN